jgi:hypothetical protein
MIRFWTFDGSQPLADSVCRIRSLLAALRFSFLAYVDRRYGPFQRAMLDSQIEKAFRDRLGYWLFRSIRFRDLRAVRELVDASRMRREGLDMTTSTLRHVLHAGLRRIRGAGAADRMPAAR